MNKNTIPFNASPISIYNTGVVPTNKQIDIIKNLEYWTPNDKNNTGGVRVSNSTNMLEIKELEDIDKMLNDCAKDYMENVLRDMRSKEYIDSVQRELGIDIYKT